MPIPDTTTDTAQGGTHNNRPPWTREMEEVLVLIVKEPTLAAAHGRPTNAPLRDDE